MAIGRDGRTRLVLVAVVAAVAAVVLARWLLRGGVEREMTLVELVEELSALDGARVEAPPGSVHVASLQPSRGAKGGFRTAIVAPPPATVRRRVRVPPDGALRYAVAVARQGRRNKSVSGVRFAVAVDGRELHARALNPAATRHDRGWFEERVDLTPFAGREVELALATTPTGGAPVEGTPGWANVRLVRETRVARQPARPAAPNVLVVLVDTLRADRLGCYGATPSPSPELDALGRGGLVFTQSVSQSSWTMPSVATLFTGLHPRSHGVVGGSCLWGGAGRDQAEADEPACAYLADGLPTLAEHAQRAGITTFGVAANPLIARSTNYTRGFETFVEFPPDSKWKRLAPAADVNRAFLDWLAAHRDWRFLAYLHYVDPHHPYTPPADLAPAPPAGVRPQVASGHVDAIAHRINRERGPLFTAPEVAHLRALYDAEIRGWDRELGHLRRALAELGVADSTVILVTADHGETFQEHGAVFHGTQLYDEQIRVPLVLAGPGIPAGRPDEPAQGIDVFPTVAALLGIPTPPALPGRNLLAPAPAAEIAAFGETRHGVGTSGESLELMTVRRGRWKLIRTPAHDRTELYDLGRDPGEREDLSGRAAEAGPLAALLAAWQETAPPPPAVRAAGDGGLHDRLRALGYVQ